MNVLSQWKPDFTWEGVPLLAYKQDGTHFRDITRQVLFEGNPQLPCQWRYFEMAADGHSTLERHEHLHVVMILRGSGRALVDGRVIDVGCFDVVQIPSMTWHQFRATNGQPLGFLCLVHMERDRPQLPDAAALEELRTATAIGAFIRV